MNQALALHPSLQASVSPRGGGGVLGVPPTSREHSQPDTQPPCGPGWRCAPWNHGAAGGPQETACPPGNLLGITRDLTRGGGRAHSGGGQTEWGLLLAWGSVVSGVWGGRSWEDESSSSNLPAAPPAPHPRPPPGLSSELVHTQHPWATSGLRARAAERMHPGLPHPPHLQNRLPEASAWKPRFVSPRPPSG